MCVFLLLLLFLNLFVQANSCYTKPGDLEPITTQAVLICNKVNLKIEYPMRNKVG